MTSDRPGAGTGQDEVLLALADLVRAADQMQQAIARLNARAALIRDCRRDGLSYREIVVRDRPLIAELLTDTIRQFQAAGTRFRQAEAQALHREGLTLEQIGALFGLTRQRISALIGSRSVRQQSDPGTPPRRRTLHPPPAPRQPGEGARDLPGRGDPSRESGQGHGRPG